MKKTIKKPKIMCPIRDWASLDACKNYADEVYFSASTLSLRQNSNNFTLKDIPKFVKECNKYNIDAFLVVNSVMYNDDLKIAEKIIKTAKTSGIKAVIVWDLAGIQIAKEQKMPFVVSTQANISNWKTVDFYKKLGASRVVLAREMTLGQIKDTIKKCKGVEVETFIHGAMCFSISGRCLLSAGIYNKSANCGSCAQPCRKEWILMDTEGHKISNQGKFFMSAQDMCMIEYIPELIEAGIDSFKIEGRRRDPLYIETTARCYREAVDAYFDNSFTKEKALAWKKELANVYNRGFSTGFYFGTPEKEGISFDKADNQSPYKKVLLGKVVHYYPKPKVALIRLYHKSLKVGDEVIFEDSNTYLKQVIDSMEIENKQVIKGKKGEDIGVKVNKPVKKGADVFMMVKKI